METGPLAGLRARFPAAVCTGCSIAGEICGATAREGSLALLCVPFDRARFRAKSPVVATADESAAAATELGRRLAAPDLRHVLVLSDGLVVNGTTPPAAFAPPCRPP